jgi:hypothetical protein
MLKANLLDYYYRFVHGVLRVKQMLVQRLERLLNEIRQRKNEHEFVQIKSAKEKAMPYHSMKKPAAKKKTGGGLTKKQKTLPKQLQQKIMASKKKKMK